MKTGLLVTLLLVWQTLAGAQTSAIESVALDPDAERQRISAERAGHEVIFQQAERLCYSRFAVSDCLRDARQTRRLALDELRRQELLLNELARQNRAVEALKRIDAKLADQQQDTLQDNSEAADPF